MFAEISCIETRAKLLFSHLVDSRLFQAEDAGRIPFKLLSEYCDAGIWWCPVCDKLGYKDKLFTFEEIDASLKDSDAVFFGRIQAASTPGDSELTKHLKSTLGESSIQFSVVPASSSALAVTKESHERGANSRLASPATSVIATAAFTEAADESAVTVGPGVDEKQFMSDRMDICSDEVQPSSNGNKIDAIYADIVEDFLLAVGHRDQDAADAFLREKQFSVSTLQSWQQDFHIPDHELHRDGLTFLHNAWQKRQRQSPKTNIVSTQTNPSSSRMITDSVTVVANGISVSNMACSVEDCRDYNVDIIPTRGVSGSTLVTAAKMDHTYDSNLSQHSPSQSVVSFGEVSKRNPVVNSETSVSSAATVYDIDSREMPQTRSRDKNYGSLEVRTASEAANVGISERNLVSKNQLQNDYARSAARTDTTTPKQVPTAQPSTAESKDRNASAKASSRQHGQKNQFSDRLIPFKNYFAGQMEIGINDNDMDAIICTIPWDRQQSITYEDFVQFIIEAHFSNMNGSVQSNFNDTANPGQSVLTAAANVTSVDCEVTVYALDKHIRGTIHVSAGIGYEQLFFIVTESFGYQPHELEDLVLFRLSSRGWCYEICRNPTESTIVEVNLADIHEGDVIELRKHRIGSISGKFSMLTISAIDRFNESLQHKVQSLTKLYSGYRKIRGDGNCYYRSVIYGLIEQLIRTDNRKGFEVLYDIFIKMNCPAGDVLAARDLVVDRFLKASSK
jgi:hypothetical protein